MNHAVDVFNFLPAWLVQALHWIGGLIVLAEAMNKLERTDPLAKGLGLRARLVVCFKVIGWLLLSLGAGGALVTPLLHLDKPTLQDACFVLGFAFLIIRTRLREPIV